MHGSQVTRSILSMDKLDRLYPDCKPQRPTSLSRLKKQCHCSKRRAWNALTTFLPVIKVVSTYRKEYFGGDLIAGLTVSFMHLPQGLAFSVLAGLPAVYGLYTTFFPLIFYMLFGASPYVAFATNAVIALLVQEIVLSETDIFESSFTTYQNVSLALAYADNSSLDTLSSIQGPLSEEMIIDNKVNTAVTASFLVGSILSLLGILRMGFLMTYMSESFIGGFTTAAGIHIVSSQVPKMFGVKVSTHSGAGKLVKMYIELFENLDKTVVSDFVITIVCMLILLFVKVCINEKFKTRLKVPIPIDLVVVVIATLMSHVINFERKLNVSIIGTIPSGFRAPTVPDLSITPRIIVDCFIMSLLILMLTISLAKLTAKIHEQRVDDNQEMVAYGLTNILSSFFSCFPQSATPSRTMLDSDLGANTTMNSLPTIVFMLLVILWIGQLFRSLPMSVLAAMITVAMKNLILQFRDLPKIWKINKLDCCVWVITCFVSVFVNLDYGIIAGIGFSVLTVVVRHQNSSSILLGVAGKENAYLDCENRENVIEHQTTKIFQFQAPLFFANAELFKFELYRKIVDPIKLKRKQRKTATVVLVNGVEVETDCTPNHGSKRKFVTNVVHYIVVDCQMISYIDLSGVSILYQIVKEYQSVGIKIFFAKCPQKFIDTLTAADFFVKFPFKHVFYDISDALLFIESNDASNDREDGVL